MGDKRTIIAYVVALAFMVGAYAFLYQFITSIFNDRDRMSKETKELLIENNLLMKDLQKRDSVSLRFRDSIMRTQKVLLQEFSKLEKANEKLRELNEQGLDELASLRSSLGGRPNF